MDELVKKYIERKEQEREEKKVMEEQERQRQRGRHLVSLGLYEKVFSDSSVTSEEYPLFDYQTGKAYKRVVPSVSDEDYERLCSFQERKADEGYKSNTIAAFLAVIAGVIYLIGFISGIVYALGFQSVFNLFFVWAAAFASGTIFLGFAEVMNLLNNISNRLVVREEAKDLAQKGLR